MALTRKILMAIFTIELDDITVRDIGFVFNLKNKLPI